MKKKSALAALALCLVTACDGGSEPADSASPPSQATTGPTTTPSPGHAGNEALGFKFLVTAQYKIQATVGNGTQDIVITIGKPGTLQSYLDTKQKSYCPAFRPEIDQVVPLEIGVSNTSPAKTPPQRIGVEVHPAVATNLLKSPIALQQQMTTLGKCSNVVPLKNASRTPMSGTKTSTALSLYTTAAPGAGTGASLLYTVLPLEELDKDAPSKVFLRLSPSNPAQGPYRIVSVLSMLVNNAGSMSDFGIAGMITSGPDQGAFYLPLVAGVNPCESIGATVPMKCEGDLVSS